MNNINQKLRKTETNTVSKWLWQVTVPLSAVSIVALTCVTMIYMTNGEYVIEIEFTPDGVKIETKMNKSINDRVCLENISSENNQDDNLLH